MKPGQELQLIKRQQEMLLQQQEMIKQQQDLLKRQQEMMKQQQELMKLQRDRLEQGRRDLQAELEQMRGELKRQQGEANQRWQSVQDRMKLLGLDLHSLAVGQDRTESDGTKLDLRQAELQGTEQQSAVGQKQEVELSVQKPVHDQIKLEIHVIQKPIVDQKKLEISQSQQRQQQQQEQQLHQQQLEEQEQEKQLQQQQQLQKQQQEHQQQEKLDRKKPPDEEHKSQEEKLEKVLEQERARQEEKLKIPKTEQPINKKVLMGKMLSGGKMTQLFQDQVDGEFYLLDGDSLLMEAAGAVGWRLGQQLHLFYAAECLLRLLASHGGSCRVVFMRDLGAATWRNQPLMQLFRRALQLHLETNCSSVRLLTEVACCWDDRFLELLKRKKPLFVLLYEDRNSEQSEATQTQINMLACCCLAHKVPVVFTGSLEQADMKLNGYFVESRPESRGFFLTLLEVKPRLNGNPDDKEYIELYAEDAMETAMIVTIDKPLLKDWLAVRASRMLKPTDAGSVEQASLWCLYFAAMSVLTYDDRVCLADESLHRQQEEVEYVDEAEMLEGLERLARSIRAALRPLSDLRGFSDPQSVADLVDVFVFQKFGLRWEYRGLLVGHPRSGLMAERYESYATQLASSDLQLLKLPVPQSLKQSAPSGRQDFQSDLPELLVVRNRLVDDFAGPLLSSLSGSSLLVTESGKFDRKDQDDTRHWYNSKELEDELEAMEQLSQSVYYQPSRNMMGHAPRPDGMERHLRMYGDSLHSDGQEVVAVTGDQAKSNPETRVVVIERHKRCKADEDRETKRLGVRWRNICSRFRYGSLTPDEAVAETCRAIESIKINDRVFEEPVLFVIKQQYMLWRMSCTDPEGERSFSALADLVHTLHQYCTEPLAKLVSPQLRITIAEFFVKVGFSDAASVVAFGAEWLKGVLVDERCLCPMSYRNFQMLHMGHLMQRNVRFDPDPRVTGFIPDTWQRELLDVVDRRESAVVVAPTSSGKTFCSYYCMRKVLEMSDETVVVYVAPTKALVNQIQAAITAKLSKPALPYGIELCGVFTRDYSYMAMNCQILVTVPQCLELLLLSPRRQGWARRIRYVIFDEVHCIGTGIGGVVWEYLICLIRCPFLALSATIHNKEYFHEWLQTIKEFTRIQDESARLVGAVSARHHQRQVAPITTGFKVNLVTYSERYSDIRTSVYLPTNKSIVEVNPCVFLNAKLLTKNGFPSSLRLSPKEAHEVWSAAVDCFQGDREASVALESYRPDGFFGADPISRIKFRDYETKLKLTVARQLRGKSSKKSQELLDTLKRSGTQPQLFQEDDLSDVDLNNEFPQMIDRLRADRRLPALVFMDNRTGMEELAKSLVVLALTRMSRLPLFNANQDLLDVSDSSWASAEFQVSYAELLKHRSEIAELAYFSPQALSEESDQVFENVVSKTIDDEEVKKMLVLGVGYHHPGCSTKHRQAVEMLFRYGYLQVVVASATLALGIHMPCKTVVFAGDDKFLNALNYHQMSGRSGRRGFDNMGNIVFYGVPATKISHLIQADLPKLRGGFPMTCAFALRLLLLTGNATDREAAHAQAITVLNHPFAAHRSRDIMEQLRLYFLFSVEFLRRRELINQDGVPQDLAALVCQIAHREPGNFVLAHLLQTRALHELCDPDPCAKEGKTVDSVKARPRCSKDPVRQLVLVLCHLFTNYPAPKSLIRQCKAQEDAGSSDAAEYTSMVLLDPLPSAIAVAIDVYNEQTVRTYTNYLKCVTGCGLFKFSRRLPMSEATPLADGASNVGGFPAVSPLTRLSVGSKATQQFESHLGDLLHRAIIEGSWQQLRQLLPQEILADSHQIPVLPTDRRLNAYALNFFNHGSIRMLEQHNGIRPGDAYALLEDFRQAIKTVQTALDQLATDRRDPVRLTFAQVTRQFDEKFTKAFHPRRRRP